MKFDIVDFNGGPVAVFNDELQPRAGLLSIFLEAIRPNPDSMIEEIEKAKVENTKSFGFTYNDVDVDICSNRVVLEELYPSQEDAETTELSIEEAEKLVIDWKNALDKWNEKHLS